jgi:uncharacterized membrane protein HdeD (DUF308 family)
MRHDEIQGMDRTLSVGDLEHSQQGVWKMSKIVSTGPIVATLRHELDAIRGKWFWFVILGIALIALGTIALGSPLISSLAVVVTLGSFILVSGIIEIVGVFWCRDWTGVLMQLLSGILAVVLGYVFLSRPGLAVETLVILLMAFLLIGGIFKIVAAVWYRMDAWIWILLSGVVDVLMALYVTTNPIAQMSILGVLLGINFIFRGVAWLMIGLRVKKIPRLESASI